MAAFAVVGLATAGLLAAVLIWGGLTFIGSGGDGGSDKEGAPRICRSCLALANFEMSLRHALDREDTFDETEGIRLKSEILSEASEWGRRCATLLCTPQDQGGACRSPSASLLSELVSIERVTAELERRADVCSVGGCLATDCGAVRNVRAAFTSLQSSVAQLSVNPRSIAGERRALATPFLFNKLSEIKATVQSLPALVVAGDYAAAEIRLLVLRDFAHSSAEQTSGSVEIFIADRLSDVSATIDQIAQAKRRGADLRELAGLWSAFAEAGARLLVETSSLETEQGGTVNPLVAIARGEFPPASLSGQTPVCDGAIRLVEAVEARLAGAVGGLDVCSGAAACKGDEQNETPAPPAGAESRQRLIDRMAHWRSQADNSLKRFELKAEPPVEMATDRFDYHSGEAVTVRPLTQDSVCLGEMSSRLVLDRLGASGEAEHAREHLLTSYDPAVWFFEAPEEPGRYIFRLLTSEDRGHLEFGRAVREVVVSAAPDGCDGFSGLWDTNFGTLRLVVRDGVVRGSYKNSPDARAGIVQGKVSGDRLTGRWLSELGAGGTRLTLSEDGQSFSGTWGSEPGKVSGAGRWTGTCLRQGQEKSPQGTSSAVKATDGDAAEEETGGGAN